MNVLSYTVCTHLSVCTLRTKWRGTLSCRERERERGRGEGGRGVRRVEGNGEVDDVGTHRL